MGFLGKYNELKTTQRITLSLPSFESPLPPFEKGGDEGFTAVTGDSPGI